MAFESELSAIENYPFLNPFRFEDDSNEKYCHSSTLQSILEENWGEFEEEVSDTKEYLAAREKVFANGVSQYFADHKNRIILNSLETENSFKTLGAYTRLLDSIVKTAFEFSFVDLPLIKEQLLVELNKEYNYKQRVLPEKQEKLRILEQQIQQNGQEQ